MFSRGHTDEKGKFHPHNNQSKKISSSDIKNSEPIPAKEQQNNKMLVQKQEYTRPELDRIFNERKAKAKAQHPHAYTQSIMTTSNGPEWLVTTYDKPNLNNSSPNDYRKIVDQYGIRKLENGKYEIFNDISRS